MAHGRERIGPHRRGQTIGRLKLLGQPEGVTATIARAIRTLRTAIGNQRDLEESRLDARNGMPNVGLERGTANVCGVGISGPDAQIFGQHEVGRPGPVASAKERVHVLEGKAGVVERGPGGLVLELQNGFTGGATEIGLGHTYNGCSGSRTHQSASPTLTWPLSRLREMM